jgi:hypothetical protein
MTAQIKIGAWTILLGALLFSCANPSTSGPPSTTGAKVQLKFATSATSARSISVGYAPASSVTSFKVFITTIYLAKTATLTSAGPTNPSGELEIYSYAGALPSDPSTYDGTTDTAGYVDLMDPNALATLTTNATITAAQEGTYKYIVVDTEDPIKVTATLRINNGATTIYTQPVTWGASTANQAPNIVSTPLEKSPAAEAVVGGGGSSVFTLETPLTISASDVQNQTAYKILLAFNPDGIIQAISASTGGNGNPQIQDLTYAIYVPPAQLTAAVCKSTESIVRETYILPLSYTSNAQFGSNPEAYDVRLALFYTSDDPTKSVVATELTCLVNSSTSGMVPFGRLYPPATETNTSGVYSFTDGGGNPEIANFIRLTNNGDTNSTIGNTAGAWVCPWTSYYGIVPSPTGGGGVSGVMYTLAAVDTMN